MYFVFHSLIAPSNSISRFIPHSHHRKLKFFFYLLLFIHALACLWYINACPPLYFVAEADQRSMVKSNYHYCKNGSWTSNTDTYFCKYSTRDIYNFGIGSLERSMGSNCRNLPQIDVATPRLISWCSQESMTQIAARVANVPFPFSCNHTKLNMDSIKIEIHD